MPGLHAKLSASGSHRWINCPGSVKAEEGIKDKTSPFAQWGTACHELSELCLLSGEHADAHLNKEVAGVTVDDEMINTAQSYIDYVNSYRNSHSLCIEKRGQITNQTYLTTERVELSFDMPLAEIVFDFYDRLKTVSKGYASFDYTPIGLRASKLVKVDVLLNGNTVDALSALLHQDNAYDIGKKMCEKLRQLIPRQQFDIPIQAAIGAKIIARETVKALRKDVTAKCYGGDISRKRKLLEKQKKGKKRMRAVGNVEIPQEAFMAVLKLND